VELRADHASFPREDAGLTADDVLDNITITWLTNTAFPERDSTGKPTPVFRQRRFKIPVAVVPFRTRRLCPRSWEERADPKRSTTNTLDKGGHVRPGNRPQTLLREVRAGIPILRSTFLS